MARGWTRGMAPSPEKWNHLPSALETGTTKAPITRRPSAEEEENHLWAVAGQAVVKAIRCVSIRTRPVSWLGPEASGTHPRTKGACCFAGRRRHRVPTTRGVSRYLAPRCGAGKASGDPSQSAEEHRSEESRDAQLAEQIPSIPQPGIGRAGRAHRCRRECALGCVPRVAGRLPRRQ